MGNYVKKMAGYKGSLIVPGYFNDNSGLKIGIWKFDAKKLAAPGKLAVEIKDEWQVNEHNKGVGLAEISYYNGMLYYNTPKAVWRWDFTEPAKPEKVFELAPDNPHQIWYIHVADGKVYYETAKYQNDTREHHEHIFDKNFKKVKHPIAVTNDVLKLKVGGSIKGDFFQAAAPGNIKVKSNDPEICDLEQIIAGKSYKLHPKKEGQTTLTVTASATDHYASGTKEVTVIVGNGSVPEEKPTVNFEAGNNASLNAVNSVTNESISNGAKVDKNTSILYTATPSAVYVIKNWTVNGQVYQENGQVYRGATLTCVITDSTNHVKVEFVKADGPLQSISLNKTAIFLAKGMSETLTVTYNPENTTDNKEVKWESSNGAVATVDSNGRIIAVSQGEAIITATSVVGGHKATCSVAVTEAPLQNWSIFIKDKITPIQEGSTVQLEVVITEETPTPNRIVE